MHLISKNGGKWGTGAVGSVTAAHSKFDALELRIVLYISCKSWDLRGDPLYMGLSHQSRDGFVGQCVTAGVPSVWCCPHWNTAPASRDFDSFSMELSQFWWNHRVDEALPKLSGQSSAAEPTHGSAGEQWPAWEGTRVKNCRPLAWKSWALS